MSALLNTLPWEFGRVAASGRLRGWLAVFGATVAMAVGFGCLALTAIFIEPLEAAFGWSRGQISLGYTVAAMGMAAGGIFWGRLADRMDNRVLLLVGSAGILSALVLSAFTVSFLQFLAANLLLGGIGFASLYAPCVTAAGEWFESRRGLAVGIVTAGGALGQGVFPYLAGQMIQTIGWREAYAAIAVLALVALAISMPFLKRPPGKAAAQAEAVPTGRSRDRSRPVTWLAAAAFMCCACMGVPLVHLASYVGAICGSIEFGSTSLLIAMLSGAVGRVCFGMIADRSGSLPAYGLASLVQTASLAAFTQVENPAAIGLLSVIFGFGFAGNMTCLILCIREKVDAGRFGSALGMVMFVAWLGMGAGGLAGGVMYDVFLDHAASLLLAVLFGLANLSIIACLYFGTTPRLPAASIAGGFVSPANPITIVVKR